MTDATALEKALRDVAGERVQAVRPGADGTASAVVDVQGLDAQARATLETALSAAATKLGITLRVGRQRGFECGARLGVQALHVDDGTGSAIGAGPDRLHAFACDIAQCLFECGCIRHCGDPVLSVKLWPWLRHP